MKQVLFQEAPDGARTAFTLAVGDRPVEIDLIFVLWNGQMAEKVASAPTGIQYTYTSGTGTATFGSAPAGSAKLYVYIQTVATKGMRIYDLVGTKNGTNKVFTVPVPLPTNSNAMVIQIDQVLKRVASGEVGEEYSDVVTPGESTTFTLATAPASGDLLYAYVEEDEASNAQFAPLTLTGTKDSVNGVFQTDLLYSEIYTPELLYMQGNVVKRRSLETPTTNYFAYDDDTQKLITPTPPSSTTALMAWQTQKLSRTDAKAGFVNWLTNPRNERIIYATVTGEKTTGSTSVFRWATSAYTTLPTDSPANTTLYPFLKEVPVIERAAQQLFYGRSFATFGRMVIANPYDHAALVYRYDLDLGANGYSLVGQTLTLLLGGPTLILENWMPILTGVCGTHELTAASEIVIPINGNDGKFLKKTTHATLTTSEYANLPAGMAGQFKPIVYGQVLNYKPQRLSTASPIYLLAGHTCNAVLAVRDKGVALAAGAGYTTQLTASGGATITLGSEPVGDVTVDFEGRLDTGGTYRSHVSYLVEMLLRQEGGLAASEINGAAMLLFLYEASYRIGLVIQQPTPLLDVLDLMVSGIPCYYGTERDGRFFIARLSTPTSAAMLTLTDAQLLSFPRVRFVGPEHHTWTVAYENVETVQNPADLATSVTQTDRAYYGTEYRTKEATDSAIINTYPLATTTLIRSRLWTSAGAQSLADLHETLFATRRVLVDIEVEVQPLSLKLGAVISFTSTRYQLGATSDKWRILAIRETFENLHGLQKSRVELTLWQ